ncbi:MAG: hypothetical protein ABI340_06135 [Nitrososphaera sp.]
MTFKKSNRTTKLMLTIILVVSVSFVGIYPSMTQAEALSNTNPVTGKSGGTISQDCMDGMAQNMKSKYASFDENLAKINADNFASLKSEVNNDKMVFRAVSQGWTDDFAHCDAKLDKIFVLYSVTDATGKERLVTVIVNPVTFQPEGIDVKTDYPKHTGSTSINSGGYDIMGASTEASSLVYRATMNWNIPTPNDPTGSFCGTTGANQCYITLWTGLSKDISALTDMAQVGTDSICKGNNCATSRAYGGFLETSSGSVSTCPTYSYSAGDSMYGEVSNQKRSGGSVTKYDFILTNTSASQTCTVTNYTFGSTDPHYAHYLSERPQFSGPTYAHLAKYSAISGLYGQIYYGGSTKTILTPYNSGWFNVVTMQNGSTQNESISGISPSNTFSITWLSSTGT